MADSGNGGRERSDSSSYRPSSADASLGSGRRSLDSSTGYRPRLNTGEFGRNYSRARDASAGGPRATIVEGKIHKGRDRTRSASAHDAVPVQQGLGQATPQDGRQDWACHACTYLHTGTESSFLACKMCNTPTMAHVPAATPPQRSFGAVPKQNPTKAERMNRVAQWTETLPSPAGQNASTGEYHTVDPATVWPDEDDGAVPDNVDQAHVDTVIAEQVSQGVISVDNGRNLARSAAQPRPVAQNRSIHAKPVPISMARTPQQPPSNARSPRLSTSPSTTSSHAAKTSPRVGRASSLGPASFDHLSDASRPKLPKRSSAPTESTGPKPAQIETRSVQLRLRIEYRGQTDVALGFTLKAGNARTGNAGLHVVSHVESGTPAASAGLLTNDVLVDVGGEQMGSLHTPAVCERLQEVVAAARTLDLGVRREERVPLGPPRHRSLPETQVGGQSHADGSVPPNRRQSLADRIMRKPKRSSFDLQGLPIQTNGESLDTVGNVVRTGTLMYWPCSSGGLSPDKSKGKSRAIILTERSVLVCKLKGEHFKLKAVIPFDLGTQIKPLSVSSFTGSQAGGFLCAFAIVLRDCTQHVFAAKTVVDKRVWLGVLEKLLKRNGVTNPYGDTATASAAAAMTSPPSKSISEPGAFSDRTQQKWELPRGAFTLESVLRDEQRGVWHSGFILGKTRCMIKIFAEEATDASVEAEVNLLKECQHPNIVQLICTSSHEDGPSWLVTELLMITIAEFLEVQGASLPITVLTPMVIQIADAVAFMHGKNFVHRCITSKTVMVDAGYTCKLASFASAAPVMAARNSRVEGLDVRWAAPEALLEGKFSPGADVWSLAVLAYVVMSNQAPLWAHVSDDALADLLKEGIRLPQPAGMQNRIYDFLSSCWSDKVDFRPPASAFASGLVLEGGSRQSIVEHISQSVVGTYVLIQPDGAVAPPQQEDDPTYAYPAEPTFAPEDVIASFTTAADLAASSSDEEDAADGNPGQRVQPLPVFNSPPQGEDPLYHEPAATASGFEMERIDESPVFTPGYGIRESFDGVMRRGPLTSGSYQGHVRGSVFSEGDEDVGQRPATVWRPPSQHTTPTELPLPLPPSNPFAAMIAGQAETGRPRANSKLEMLRAQEQQELDFSEDL